MAHKAHHLSVLSSHIAPLDHSVLATQASLIFFKPYKCPHLRPLHWRLPHLLELSSLICSGLAPSTHICAKMSLFLSCHSLCPFLCFIFLYFTHHIHCVCVCVCVRFFSVCLAHENISSTRVGLSSILFPIVPQCLQHGQGHSWH